LKLRNHNITGLQNSRHRERGYLMITLMLAVALISIALLAAIPAVKQQIARDREEEMRHRGTAYMRAIQHFYKKFGRYPNRLEELENTNNIRFLRKRYTDPLNRDPATGKERDFKLLHQQDVPLNLAMVGGIGAGGIGTGGIGQGGIQGANGIAGALLGAQAGAQAQGTPNSSSPANANSANAGDDDDKDSGSPGSSGSSSSSNSSSSSSASGSGSGSNSQTFGGGPILGVASTSKKESIRVFSDKNHYKDWLFLYLAQADRGGLLTGPISLNPPANIIPGQGGGAAGQSGGVTSPGGLSNPSQPQTPTPTPPSPTQNSPQN
jgi:type II secretory pathway pseudopilin PulG